MSNKVDENLLLEIINEASETFILTDSNYNLLYAFPEAVKILEVETLSSGNNIERLIDCIDNTSIVTFKNNSSAFLKVLHNNNKLFIFTKETELNKTRLLASLSHDMKGPIQSLKGFAQALTGGMFGELTEKQIHFINIINKNADILLRMIVNTVDYSKLHCNRVTINEAPFVLDELLVSTEKQIKPLLEQKKDRVELKINKKVSKNIYFSDKDRLEQVLVNLIENSLRFIDEGVVSVELKNPDSKLVKHYFPDNSNNNEEYLHFKLSDSLNSIKPELQNHLFDDTTPPETEKNQCYGINRMNLIVSKLLIDKLGGILWFEESENKEQSFNILMKASKP